MADEAALAVLTDTRRVFRQMRKCRASAVSDLALKDWKAVVRRANHAIARLHAEIERHRVEMAVFSEEVRQELVQREASAARTADRFRVLHEKDGGTTRSVFDRALASAHSVESSLADLCPHEPCRRGCRVLADRTAAIDGCR